MVDLRTIKYQRKRRCCRYSGTVDCAPCDGPRSDWNIYKRGPGKIDPQQVWLHTGDGSFLALGNFRQIPE